MSVSTTPLLGDTAPGRTWPSIGGEYYTPTLHLFLWHTGGPGSSLSDVRRISLEGKGRRAQDDTRVTCHAREKNYGDRTPPSKDAEERPAAATSVTTHFQAKSIKCASGDLCQLPGKFFVWTAQAQEFSAANYGPDTAPVRCPDCRKNRTRSCMLARRGPHQGAGGSGGGRG
jgi:hypothetical protein